PAVPGREGYTFTGWDVDFNNVTSDLTVTAQYQIMTFTVTFLGRNGFVSEQTVEYGSAAAAPAVPDDGFWRFFAWDREFDCVTENITVNAIYGLKGDVNCDGVVDSADITLAAAYSMSAGEVTPLGVFNGDMNNDGILNAADLSALYGYIQG
ncbi:MAG: InlB B-repeat-containing protein, partial [Clostridia bacterium]|nr:InlB B-repeat-containing protein [Clostridia bacterium]